MHSTAHPPPETWQGIVFLAAGIIILLASPKIVSWQIVLDNWRLKLIKRVSSRLLDFVGYDGEFLLSKLGDEQDPNSNATGWTSFSNWFSILFVGALFLAFGAAILLKLPDIEIF
ncbi:MAG: hypothetical protein ACRYFS_23865 [Janthinobacterium lividum]